MPYHPGFGGRHFVYRQFDAAGVLLYIGMSSSVKVRYAFHERKSPWFAQVAEWKFEEFDSRASAAAAERAAIAAECPLHNKRGKRSTLIREAIERELKRRKA